MTDNKKSLATIPDERIVDKLFLKTKTRHTPPRTKIQKLPINHDRVCVCKLNNLNCLTAKEWMKSQLGVWQFYYEKRDIRKKDIHPATFPIALTTKLIGLFTHKGELVVDPFNGSGTTLLSANDLGRNAVGFDISKKYCKLSDSRLPQGHDRGAIKQFSICDDARRMDAYFRQRWEILVKTTKDSPRRLPGQLADPRSLKRTIYPRPVRIFSSFSRYLQR